MNSAPLSTRSAPEAVAKEVKIKKFPDSSKTAYHQTLNKGQSLDPHDPPTPMFSHESMDHLSLHGCRHNYAISKEKPQ